MRVGLSLSLSIKLPLVLSVAVACVAATIGFAMVERDRQRLREELHGRALLLARTVAAVAPEWIVHGDTWSLFKSLRQITQGPDDAREMALVSAMVLDPAGRVLAHLQPALFPIGIPVVDIEPSEKARLDAELAFQRPGVFDGPDFMEGVAPVLAGGQAVGLARVRLSMSEMDAQSKTAGRTVLLLSVGMALLGIGLGATLSIGMLRPLQRLTHSMRDLARGKFNPLHTSRSDEIGQLVESFNRMAAELEDNRRAQAEMAANEKVLALGRIAAGVAHEVNNPLAGMLNCLSTLRAEKNDPALVARYLPLIESALRKIEALVKDLLIELRVEDAEEIGDPRSLDDVRDLIGAEIDPGLIAFDWTSDLAETDFVNGSKMQQILLNLLRNAIQAMPSGGRLTCRLRGEAGGQVFEVEDTGDGIPQADIPRIFDPFFTSRPNGTGLGLWIVLRLVRSMHGTIEVDSIQGHGTRFRIQIPRGQQRATQSA